MRFVSPFLRKVLYPTLSTAGLLSRAAGEGLAVVTYHGVVPAGYEPIDPILDGNLVTAKTFRHQLGLLKKQYCVVTPEDVLAWVEGGKRLPRRAVMITCDDGLRNNLTDMLPILQQEGVQCLFFVTGASADDSRSVLWYEELFLILLKAPGGRIDISASGLEIVVELKSLEDRRAVWWNLVKQLSQAGPEVRALALRALRDRFRLDMLPGQSADDSPGDRRFGLLTCTELRQLAAGGMTIGAHTLSHPMLSVSPPDLMRYEVVESRARLESALQSRVWAFAYPFGDAQSVTPQVIDAAREAGYQAAFVNLGGGLGADLPAHALPRVHITAEMGLGELDAHVSGLHAWLQRTAGRSRQDSQPWSRAAA